MDSVSGCILIVDDDAALLRLMDAYLTRLGHRVDACGTAEQAWALLEAGSSSYSAVLVDMHLPDTSGAELARRILDRHPAIRLILLSGDPGELSAARSLDGALIGFLRKPFAAAQLAAAVATSEERKTPM